MPLTRYISLDNFEGVSHDKTCQYLSLVELTRQQL